MTTSQVTRRGNQTFIRLGRHDVPVPGPLANAVFQLISDGRSYRGVGSPPATAWLFPGHLPGRPITAARLGERLRSIGIYAQTGRRAALLDLAAQLPAAVLADLLGLHETTAAKWMHQSRRRDLDPLRGPASPRSSSPDLTNTSPHPGPVRSIGATLGKPLPTSSETSGHNRAELKRRLGHANDRYLRLYTNPPDDIAVGYVEDL